MTCIAHYVIFFPCHIIFVTMAADFFRKIFTRGDRAPETGDESGVDASSDPVPREEVSAVQTSVRAALETQQPLPADAPSGRIGRIPRRDPRSTDTRIKLEDVLRPVVEVQVEDKRTAENIIQLLGFAKMDGRAKIPDPTRFMNHFNASKTEAHTANPPFIRDYLQHMAAYLSNRLITHDGEREWEVVTPLAVIQEVLGDDSPSLKICNKITREERDVPVFEIFHGI